jgi:hypothetical protein
MSVEIKSGATSDLLTVDPTSKAVRTTLYDTNGDELMYSNNESPTTPKGMLLFGLNDATVKPARMDRLGGLASAGHTMLLHDSFESTVIHPHRWLVTNTTMAATQATITGLLFNSGNITTVTTGYMIKSSATLMKNQRSPLQVKFRARLNHFNNSVMELGFGDAATFNGVNTTGAYWQMTAAGVLQPVLTFNSVDQTGTDIRSLITTANYYTFDVFMDDDEAVFVCQDTSTNEIISRQAIQLPLTAPRLLSSTQIQVLARLYNTGVAPATAPQMILTDVYALALDNMQNKTWPQVNATNYRAAPIHPFSGVQLTNYTNSAAATSATLSNTAAGYTTLGGLWQFAAVAGAATDYALFGFTVPTNSNLVVTGIDIEAYNTVVAVATTPTLLVWSAGIGSTAVSLATATVCRIPLGVQSFPIGAVAGASAQRISKVFSTPLVIPSGRFFHIILRMPVATATATQVVAGMVTVDGYFE